MLSQFVIASAYFFEPSVAEDPSGATDCTTQWNKKPELVILLEQEFSKYIAHIQHNN